MQLRAPRSIVLAILTALAPSAAAQDGARTWSGAYAGGHFGWGWGATDWASHTEGDATRIAGRAHLYNGYDLAGGTGSYLKGLQVGYDYLAAPGLIVGVQADASFPNRVEGSGALASGPAGPASFTIRQEWTGTVRGRAGLLHGGWLFYGTAGWSWSWDRLTIAQNGSDQSARVFHSGWVAGAGVEAPMGHGWSAALEYLVANHGQETGRFDGGRQTISADLAEHSLRLALNYRWNAAAGLAQSERPKSATANRLADISNWALHGQTTYVHQYAFPFNEPYRGTNSLIPRQSRQTWDATAYLGFKPWSGGELWFNPEIVQGFGLANTLGLAGFSSGEAYKLGSAYPYARIPRFFLRQTIDLGGTDEKVESAINQFAGTRKTDRLVLTLGKFSASDIFDDNKFAHDPRVDFLNWSLIDTGNWDYAADAWGYTYGAAAEYVRGAWTLGAGAFLLPRFPNNTAIDTSFSQHQFIGEIERRHTLWGQPGEINLTGFLSHARMGRFDDAIRLARITNSAADIAAVWRMQNRTGIAASIEQNITDDIGAFLRAGISDGRYEPFAFTDIDRTLAAGLSIGGSAWGRPKDTLGIAGVVNAITGVHQRFLDAGGLGILVGDDRLPRPGTERILETYYSLAIRDWRLTLDYQYVVNPAYNTERGPVSIIGTRLRSSF